MKADAGVNVGVRESTTQALDQFIGQGDLSGGVDGTDASSCTKQELVTPQAREISHREPASIV
jgi:hypothetical protein